MEQTNRTDFHLVDIIIPLNSIIDSIQPYREKYTNSGSCGLTPHITVVHPFAKSITDYQSRIESLKKLCSDISPFSISFSSISRFKDNGVLFLKPANEEEITKIIKKVYNGFPDINPYNGRFTLDQIKPHCTIAISDSGKTLNEVEENLFSLKPDPISIEEEVSEFWCVVKASEQYYLYEKIKLGSEGNP
ncbi:MAG: 2'-5' RNA ligase family protein [Spirochaetales bacterium]|nr:2'-5' RNA ligase family protein [Spirochaetales bacterium]